MTDTTLGEHAARGAGITLLAQLLRTGTQLIGILILARVLAPSDFGYLAMVTAIIGLGEVIRDLGLSSAAIQAKSLSRQQRDNLFWINVAVGALLTAIVFALSIPIAHFYGRPELVGITQALSFTFLLNGLATQHRASINREMRFGALALIDLTAPLVALATAVALASYGLEYWALVWQQIVLACLTLALSWALGLWLPRWWRKTEGFKELLSFGGTLALVQVLTYLSKNVDSMIIGSRFGASTLGLYDRAFQIVMMPLNQVNAPSTRVALPVLSRLQDVHDRFAAFLERGQRALVNPLFAALMGIAVLADPLVRVLLGQEWAESAVFVRVLAIAGMAQVASYALYWVFLAKRMAGSNLRYALVTRPVVIAALLIGAVFGPIGVAAAYAIVLCAMWPFGYYWVRHVPGVRPKRLIFNGLQALLRYTPAAIAAVLALVVCAHTAQGPFVTLIASGIAYTLGLVCLLLLSRSAREDWSVILGRLPLFRRLRKERDR